MKNELIPKKVEALTEEEIVDVACGLHHTYAITSTGLIYEWGYDRIDNRIFLPTLLPELSSKGVICLSVSVFIKACVTRAGEVFTWGKGGDGRLGHEDESDQKIPKRVEALVGVKVKQVSCGGNHTVVCTEDGDVYTFGSRGDLGQLGHGDKEKKTSPAQVEALKGKQITQVQCGWNHTMALTSSGYVFTWGFSPEKGCLGHGKDLSQRCLTIPCLVEGLREHNVLQITSGYDHCAVLVDPSPSTIRQYQQASFNNKENSNVVFMVEKEPIYANTDFLSSKSDYFAAMFRCNMKESIERIVGIPECSRATFIRVLEYQYFDGYAVSMDEVLELWVFADMYQVEGLKLSCMGLLERSVCEENVSRILEEAEYLSCPCDELKRLCHECLDHLKINSDY